VRVLHSLTAGALQKRFNGVSILTPGEKRESSRQDAETQRNSGEKSAFIVVISQMVKSDIGRRWTRMDADPEKNLRFSAYICVQHLSSSH
jgi:hypothetical protein